MPTKAPVLLQSGFFSNQKFARPAATLAFFRMPKAQQAAQFKFAASSKANQQLLRKAVVKTGGFTKIFISPATTIKGKPSIVIGKPKTPNLNISTFSPPKTALAPKVGMAQPGAGAVNFPLFIALGVGAFLLLRK